MQENNKYEKGLRRCHLPMLTIPPRARGLWRQNVFFFFSARSLFYLCSGSRSQCTCLSRAEPSSLSLSLKGLPLSCQGRVVCKDCGWMKLQCPCMSNPWPIVVLDGKGKRPHTTSLSKATFGCTILNSPEFQFFKHYLSCDYGVYLSKYLYHHSSYSWTTSGHWQL